MAVSIYVFAEEVTVPPYRSLPPRSSEKTYRVVIPTGTHRYALTSFISRAKQREEKISTLHLVAHGAPGILFLSGGAHPDRAIDADACSWFGALKVHFDKTFPRVVIHGCNSASNQAYCPPSGEGTYNRDQQGIGYAFLLAMAQATNTIVEGGIHTQLNDWEYELEGSRITVGPNGAAPGAEFQHAPIFQKP